YGRRAVLLAECDVQGGDGELNRRPVCRVRRTAAQEITQPRVRLVERAGDCEACTVRVDEVVRIRKLRAPAGLPAARLRARRGIVAREQRAPFRARPERDVLAARVRCGADEAEVEAGDVVAVA